MAHWSCFKHCEYLQFSGSECVPRSLLLRMKLHSFCRFCSLLLVVAGAGALAMAQTSTPPASQNPSSSSAQTPTSLAPPSSTPAADDKSANAAGQSGKTPDASAQGQTGNQQQVDPLKRPLTEKQKKANAKAMKQELSSTYKKWLNEDVRWIITPEELAAFKQLSNDEERDAFIEQFWLRRDPTPDTPENEYKEEHYRRIAYANEHFPAGFPGWRTDRGRIYIMYGPADQIESHPSGGTYDRPMEEGGGTTSTFPFEDWRYRYIEGIGQEINLEFVDTCMCGDYHLTMDVNEKDALLHTPGGGLTWYEQQGLSSKTSRVTQGPFAANAGAGQGLNNSKQFDKLEL